MACSPPMGAPKQARLCARTECVAQSWRGEALLTLTFCSRGTWKAALGLLASDGTQLACAVARWVQRSGAARPGNVKGRSRRVLAPGHLDAGAGQLPWKLPVRRGPCRPGPAASPGSAAAPSAGPVVHTRLTTVAVLACTQQRHVTVAAKRMPGSLPCRCRQAWPPPAGCCLTCTSEQTHVPCLGTGHDLRAGSLCLW